MPVFKYIIVDKADEPFVNCCYRLLNGLPCGKNARTVLVPEKLKDMPNQHIGICDEHLIKFGIV